MSPDSNHSNFKSFRIIGMGAQKFLVSAKKKIKEAAKHESVEPETIPLKDAGYQHVVVHLSPTSVVKATFAIIGIGFMFLFLFAVRDTIILLLLAVFIAVVIDPLVSFLHRFKLPRGLCVLLVYLIILALVTFLALSLIPMLAAELQRMSIRLAMWIDAFLAEPSFHFPFVPETVNMYFNTLMRQFLAEIARGGTVEMLSQFGQRLSIAAQGSLSFVIGVAGSVVSFVVSFILVLVLAFFLQLERDKVIHWVRQLFPVRYRGYLEGKADAIYRKLAQWIHGQLMLSLAIACLVFVALLILRMPYPLTLALLAGFTEFIPVIGPIIAAIPAIFIALSQGVLNALVVALVYYGIQWCENNLLVPIIMKRAVGLSPIAIILAMLIGVSFPAYIHPVLGVILSVPVGTIIALFLKDLTKNR